MNRIAYRPSELLELLPISRSVLYQLLSSNQIENVRVGKSILIPHDAVLCWIDKLKSENRGNA